MKEERELLRYLVVIVFVLVIGMAIPFVIQLSGFSFTTLAQTFASELLGIALIIGFLAGTFGRYLMRLDWSGDLGGSPYVYNILEGVVGVIGLFLGVILI